LLVRDDFGELGQVFREADLERPDLKAVMTICLPPIPFASWPSTQ